MSNQYAEIILEMKQYIKKISPSFASYQDFAGWQPWMEYFTEAKDGEVCEQHEIKNIEQKQEQLWKEAGGSERVIS